MTKVKKYVKKDGTRVKSHNRDTNSLSKRVAYHMDIEREIRELAGRKDELLSKIDKEQKQIRTTVPYTSGAQIELGKVNKRLNELYKL